MLKTKLYFLISFLALFAISSADAAPKKRNYKKRSTAYVKRGHNYNYARHDSLLNVPKIKPVINYDEKDIPYEYIIKLDSALNDYQKSRIIRSSQCTEDSAKAELLDDSTYISRLQRIPSIVELTYNSVVRDFISLYTIRRKNLTAMILGQSDYYFPIFENALDAEGVPFELKYLPVIESALNPRAYSPAGASGLWQFIASTGRTYGLRVNSLVDERRDPIKSSVAAAKYLKHLYEIYHDWTLVIAAYNCGPGNVNKAIRRAGGVKDYWAIYPFLPRETRGYVPAFIAATYAMNYHVEHNICPRGLDLCVTDTIHVTDKVHLQQIADVLDLDLDGLRDLNPQYKTDIIPGHSHTCTLILPVEKLTQYEMYKNTILAYEVPGYNKNREVVEPHTLSAYRGGANTKRYPNQQKNIEGNKQIAEKDTTIVNVDTSKTNIQPQKKQMASTKPQTPAKSKALADTRNDIKYIVKQGDTLYGIATRNNVSVVNLKKWNSLDSDKLRIGQVLVLKNK